MVQNATIFKQAGYSDDDATTLARVSSLYQNVADSEVSAQEAGQFVVSQLKAYGLAASDAASIVDKLNSVSNNYSVSNSDLAIGLTKSAAALQTLGNTQDEVMGLLTAGTEQLTGQASKVGKGLQTIGINIAQVATEAGELSYEVGNTTKTISLLDEATGDMRSTFDVLSDIAKDWDNMTDAQQTAISNALAGKTRFDVFAAVMTRFDDAISATTTSMNSFGSAEAENAKYMESLSAKTALLKQQFQELVLGDGGLEKVGKIFLDLSINTLKLVNDLGGLKTIATALIGLVVVNKADTIVSLFKNLPLLITSTTTSMKDYLTAVYATITGNKKLTAALELEGIAVNSAKLAFGSFFAVLTLGIAIYSHLKQAEEEALAQRQETIKTAKDEIASLEQLKSKLDDESLTREDLSNIVSNSTISAYKDEMDAISDLNEARQGAIDKIDEEIQKNAELIKSTGFTDYVDAIEGLGEQANRYYSMQDFADISTIAYQKGIDIDTSSLEAYYESLQKIQTAMTSEDTNKYAKFIEILGNEISKANTDLQNFNQTVEKYNGALGVLGEVYDATLGKIVPMTEEQKEAYKTQQESTEALNKQGQAYELTDEEIQQYAEDMGISIDEAKEQLGIITEQAKSYEDLAKSIGVSTEELQSYAEMLGLTAEQAALLLSEQNSLNSEIDGIQSAYSTLSSAVKEYNEQGGYSIDTLQSLLELDPEYLSMLQFEGEQLIINEEAIRNRVIAWAEEAKQGAYNIAIERMKALAAGQSGEATEDSAQKSVGAIEKHNKNTEAILNEANAELYLATVEARRSKLGTADDEIKQIYTDLENQLNAIDKLVDNVGKNFEGTMGSASKSTKSSVKEQKSALDQLKDKYKDVINFILDGYDKQIDKLEDARDAEIDRIEAEIDALEKERDARKEYWDGQLDALEKNNDATEDAITLQEKLNALATAQQTKQMVFKDGRFRYSSDEEAVSSAQSDIDEFNREQEYKKQKELLEQLRDAELDNYDKRLDDLESFKEERQKYYEEQIEDLKAQKEATKELLENGVKDQKEYEDKMLAQLGNFVADWNATVGAMSFPDISGSGIDVGSISVSQTSSGGSSTKTTKTTTTTKPKTTTTSKSTKSKDKNIHVKGGRIMAYASGTNSIKDNEIALVGDNPKYRELVIGSKLNNDQGTLMRLSSGSGVVNADSTKTLASIFNSLSGQINSAPFANNGVNNGTTISIGSISLPEVKDGQGFVDYMQHFSTDITQQSFNRV